MDRRWCLYTLVRSTVRLSRPCYCSISCGIHVSSLCQAGLITGMHTLVNVKFDNFQPFFFFCPSWSYHTIRLKTSSSAWLLNSSDLSIWFKRIWIQFHPTLGNPMSSQTSDGLTIDLTGVRGLLDCKTKAHDQLQWYIFSDNTQHLHTSTKENTFFLLM